MNSLMAEGLEEKRDFIEPLSRNCNPMDGSCRHGFEPVKILDSESALGNLNPIWLNPNRTSPVECAVSREMEGTFRFSLEHDCPAVFLKREYLLIASNEIMIDRRALSLES
jgi:hypothetical protein